MSCQQVNSFLILIFSVVILFSHFYFMSQQFATGFVASLELIFLLDYTAMAAFQLVVSLHPSLFKEPSGKKSLELGFGSLFLVSIGLGVVLFFIYEGQVDGRSSESPGFPAIVKLFTLLAFALMALNFIYDVKDISKDESDLNEPLRSVDGNPLSEEETKLLQELKKLYSPSASMTPGDRGNLIFQLRHLFGRACLLQAEVKILEERFTYPYLELGQPVFCPYCAQRLQVGERVVMVGCTHAAHFNCLVVTGQGRPTCIVCNEVFRHTLVQHVSKVEN